MSVHHVQTCTLHVKNRYEISDVNFFFLFSVFRESIEVLSQKGYDTSLRDTQ